MYRHPETLSDDLYLIAEAYADAGYETFYWNGHSMASGELNYAQGVPPANLFKGALVADDTRFIEILERLASDPDYKALIITNPLVTHGPYRSRHAARFLREYPGEALDVTMDEVGQYAPLYRANSFGLTWNHAATLARLDLEDDLDRLARVIEILYRANINHLDGLFGEVTREITSRGLLGESLIVFTADHGEVLYRESATFKWTHSMLLDHEVLGVPLIIHSSRIPSTRPRYVGVTRSIDVFPTMAGLSGIELPMDRGIQGVDLSKTLIDGLPAARLKAYSHSTVLVRSVFRQMYDEARAHNWLEARRFFPDESADHMWVAVRSDDGWFKHRKLEDGSWVTQAYDLGADPAATHDTFDLANPAHAAIRAELLAYKAMLVKSYRRNGKKPGTHTSRSERDEKLLRSLGYIE